VLRAGGPVIIFPLRAEHGVPGEVGEVKDGKHERVTGDQ
jgi:hypothetical protein